MAAYQLFQLPKQLNISSSFTLSAGAKAYFYATTTTTPQDTYTTSALNVAHPNPVVADAAGVLPPIYLDPTLQYKLTLKTAADTLIYTVDPVNDQVLSAAIITALLTQSIIGGLLYPVTAEETAALVTPTNYAYPPLDVRRYGAVGDNSTDCTTALQNWLKVLNIAATSTQSHKSAYLPAGRYLITASIGKLIQSKCSIIGDGTDASRIVCGGSGSYTALQIGADLPSGISNAVSSVTVRDLGFMRTGSGTLTLLKVNYADWSVFENIVLYGTALTTCLDYAGHENNVFRNVVCYGTNPVIMRSYDTSVTSTGCDHTTFDGLEMFSYDETKPLIQVVAPCSLSNIKFTGSQVWLGGSRGFEFIANSAWGVNIAECLVFENVRRESASASTTGACFYIHGAATERVGSVVFNSCLTSTGTSGTQEGWDLDYVRRPTLVGCATGGGAIKVTAKAYDSTYELATINCGLTTYTLTNFELVSGGSEDVLSAGQQVRTAVYQWDGNADETHQTKRGARSYEGRQWVGKSSLGDDVNRVIPSRTTSEALVLAMCSAGTGTAQCGLWMITDGVVTKVTGTANTAAADTDTNLCVYWDGGTNRARVKNRMGETRDVLVFDVWGP
jgi:hypothetical protein